MASLTLPLPTSQIDLASAYLISKHLEAAWERDETVGELSSMVSVTSL